MSGADAGAGADAIVIGGGFYGAALAVYLARSRRLRTVLVEREPRLLTRASYSNQARVHNGYHYPRSLTTAFRSRINLPRFLRNWPDAVRRDFTKLYAIARRNSKVTPRQFERFCMDIGAPLRRAEAGLHGLFEPRLIAEVYLVEEYAFDTRVLAARATQDLCEAGVQVRCGVTATGIRRADPGLAVDLRTAAGAAEEMQARYVFNCAYSGLNQFGGDFPGTTVRLKQEVTEMALMEMPPELRDLAVTVMDGPFFSAMPFPARGLHTLSHVRYTPHFSWLDAVETDPYDRLAAYDRASRADRMVRDAARYLPALGKARHAGSLFEVKTVMIKNEGDDGRPILFERHAQLPGCFSVLGGKIDNIYDVLEKLDAEPLQ